MGRDDDQRKADWWFHRNHQLDWKDQQAATERELERLRLRGGDPSGADITGHEPRAKKAVDRSELALEIAGRYDEIVDRLRDAGIEAWRSDKWISILNEVNPLRAESATFVERIRQEIQSFLNTTTDWELGRRSLGSGMVIRDSLELTRFMLLNLKLEIEDYLRKK